MPAPLLFARQNRHQRCVRALAAGAADRLRDAEDDEAPAPFFEVLDAALHARLGRAEAGVKRTIEPPTDGAHWATPRTRRVTVGPEWPASPDTTAASEASSSSRCGVRRGARAASAMIAA